MIILELIIGIIVLLAIGTVGFVLLLIGMVVYDWIYTYIACSLTGNKYLRNLITNLFMLLLLVLAYGIGYNLVPAIIGR